MDTGKKLLLLLLIVLGVVLGALWIIGGRPANIETSIQIAAAPQDIFDWLVQPEKRTQWTEHLVSTALVSSSPEGQPLAWESVYDHDGKRETLDEQILQYQPGDFLSVRSRRNGCRVTRVYRLEKETQAVRLRIEHFETAEGVGRLWFALSARDPLVRMKSEAQSLKKLVEQNRTIPVIFGDPLKENPPPAASDGTKPNQ